MIRYFSIWEVDEDPSEMARRSKFCQDSDTENDEGAKGKCVKLERINTARNSQQAEDIRDEDAEPAIAAAEAIADGSMSASKNPTIMQMVILKNCKNFTGKSFHPRYVIALANSVRQGLKLTDRLPIFQEDFDDSRPLSLSPPSEPDKTFSRLAGTMAGPGLIDDTYRSRKTGWTDVQRTHGRNAIGLSGVQSVRNAERVAKESQLYSIPETEEKEGGRRRKTRRYHKRSGKKSCTKRKRRTIITAIMHLYAKTFLLPTTCDGGFFG